MTRERAHGRLNHDCASGLGLVCLPSSHPDSPSGRFGISDDLCQLQHDIRDEITDEILYLGLVDHDLRRVRSRVTPAQLML